MTGSAVAEAPPPPAPGPPQTREETVSPAHLQRHRVVAAEQQNPDADIFRVLRTHVVQRLARDKLTTLGVTSPNPGEGKTLTAVNLAISLSLDVNYTVLLVDLDLRRPGVHRFFGLKSKLGLGDYLTGKAELGDCLVRPGFERLVVLPGLGCSGGTSELLSAPRMTQLAAELKQRYPDRLVIYDLPPLFAADDTLAVLPRIDAVLLVLMEGETQKKQVKGAIQLLEERHNLIGTVLNKSTDSGPTAYY